MNDMSAVIVPKSDQINADDLISGPRTVRVVGVDIRPGTEQPVAIALDGTDKVFRPCKSMSRVLVAAWGPNAKAYVGRSITLYRDPKVKWGGLEVGGIRISHLSHMDREMVIALTATKGKRAPHSVKPLPGDVIQHQAQASFGIEEARRLIAGAPDLGELERTWKRRDMAPFRTELQADLEDRKAALTFETEGPADTDRGDGFDDGGADTHPALAKAADIIAKLEAAKNIDELGAVMAEARPVMDAMPEEASGKIYAAKARCQAALVARRG